MSKKSKKTSDAIDWAKPALTQGVANTQDAYAAAQPIQQNVTGTLGNVFGNYATKFQQPSAYTGFGNDNSIGLLTSAAGAPRATGNYSGYGAGNPAMDALAALSKGSANGASGQLSALGDGGFVGTGDAADYWKRVLGGDYLNGDANFNTTVNTALDDVQRRVNAQFGGSGAVNQTAHSDLLARNLANTDASLRSANYQAERARQDAAASGLDAAMRGDRGQQIQSLGLLSDNNNADRAAQLAGATAYGNQYNDNQRLGLAATQAGDTASSTAFNDQLKALGLLSDANNKSDSLRLDALKAGDTSEAQRLQSLLALASAYGASPYSALNPYVDNINTLSGKYGVQTSKDSGLGNALGTVAQLGGAAGSLLGGAGLSGLLGGAGGLSNLSQGFASAASTPLVDFSSLMTPNYAGLPRGY